MSTDDDIRAKMRRVWEEATRRPQPDIIQVSWGAWCAWFDALHRERFERAVSRAWFRLTAP